MFKRAPILIWLLIGIALLCGCSMPTNIVASTRSASSEIKAAVTVVVTLDFGKELILERDIEIKPGTTAMDALQMVASLETKYGGSFVNSINGIKSEYGGINGKKKDWFFSINGIVSNMGAEDYILRAGDLEHWDFHDWSFYQSIPAIIDRFPVTFKYGYGGNIRSTIIAYADGFIESTDILKQWLIASGVQASSQSLSELSENEKKFSNLLLLGTSDNQLISELNRNWKRLGFLAYFENNKLVTQNADGQGETQYGAGTGLIQATQNPWNPDGISAAENVAWLVSGTDTEGVKTAVDKLVNHSDELKYTFAALVSGGMIVKLPQ